MKNKLKIILIAFIIGAISGCSELERQLVMQTIAIEQTSIFDDIFDDETIPCFCGD